MARELLFSVTADDCRWDYYRGSGKGGQHRNKTSSAVRCTHVASGAVGQCEDSRSQHENKRIAFRRMASTATFKGWHDLEVARVTGAAAQMEERVELAMKPHHLKIEVMEGGTWRIDA